MALTYTDVQNGEAGSSVRAKINNFINACLTQVNTNTSAISTANTDITAIESLNVTQGNTLVAHTNTLADLQVQIDGKSDAHVLVLDGLSIVAQTPVALNTPIQVSFGAAQTLPAMTLSALGSITILEAGAYSIVLNATYGRTSSTGIAILFGRFEKNGVMLGQPIAMKSDAAQMTLPYTQTGIGTFAVNDVITFNIYRDSAGLNEGGLYPIASTLAGWTTAPSAQIQVYRV